MAQRYDFRFWVHLVFKERSKEAIYNVPKKDIALFVRWLPNMIMAHPRAFHDLNRTMTTYTKQFSPHDIVWTVNQYLYRAGIDYIKYTKAPKK